MNNEIVISAQNITKNYYISEGLFSFLKKDKIISAINGISLDVNKGEILGIFGRNGSGKSTLLKILSQVTKPSSGQAVIYGKLVSAIEVVSGFNLDLSGIENIRNLCQIWGLTSKEVNNIEGKIIEFSNLADFIHIPVKKISTGMIGRLAASIIIHLKADIYIFDEALSGSDQLFTRKLHQKLIDMQNESKTILIASHKITDLLSLCSKAIVLEEGKIIQNGNAFEALICYQNILNNYVKNIDKDIVINTNHNIKNNFLDFNNFNIFKTADNYKFSFSIKTLINSISSLNIYIIINNSFDIPIGHTSIELYDLQKETKLSCNLPNSILNNGVYIISLAIQVNTENLLFFPKIIEFEAINNMPNKNQTIPGILITEAKWETSN